MFSIQYAKELFAVSCVWGSSYLSQSLSNTIRRLFIRHLICYSRRIYPPTSTVSVLQLPGNLILKIGSSSILREAESMHFVSRHASIPIPRILDTWLEPDDVGYLVMERLPGQTLRTVWRDLTSLQRDHIAAQLKGFIDHIRCLNSPSPGAVSSLQGGPFKEDRLDFDDIGPFASEHVYHDWRVSLASNMAADSRTLERIQDIRTALRDDHGIVFTHGDLNPSNILIHITGAEPEDAQVVGLLDWEMSGWRPAYWEYVKCMHGMGDQAEWMDFVAKIVAAFPEEHRLDDELQRMSGEPF